MNDVLEAGRVYLFYPREFNDYWTGLTSRHWHSKELQELTFEIDSLIRMTQHPEASFGPKKDKRRRASNGAVRADPIRHFCFRVLALSVALPALLLAQMDPHEIVRRSLANETRSWEARCFFTFTQRDIERHLDFQRRVKSAEVDVSRMVLVNGEPVTQITSHNGGPPTAAEQRRNRELLRKRQAESPAERTARLRSERDGLAFINEVAQAFRFRIAGKEQINGRYAYRLEATPRPGYHAHSKYGSMFGKVRGTLWVDEQDFGWVKVEATLVDSFFMGFLVARVQPGTRIILFDQTPVEGGLWMPARVEITAAAKVFFLMNYNSEEIVTYSDYRPLNVVAVSQSKAGSSGGR